MWSAVIFFCYILESAVPFFSSWCHTWLSPSFLYTEASAKTKDGVQCAFEELVEKILQTPGLWESDQQGHRVRLGHQEQGGSGGGACGGYCSIPWTWTRQVKHLSDRNDYRPETERKWEMKRGVEEQILWTVGRVVFAVCTLPVLTLSVTFHISHRRWLKGSCSLCCKYL